MILYLKNKIKSIMYAIVGMSIPNHSIAIYKTLIINFKLFGFNGIKILPILVYHNTKIFSIGKISFGIPLKHGLLTIGKLDLKSQGITKFNNKGEIIIKGYVEIGLAKGKKLYDKRQDIAKKDQKREAEKELKVRLRA